jgi:GMP synthase-like glutamine amidotransferase
MLKDRLFFGTEPTSTREIFQQFLGRNINLQCVSATEAPTSLNGIAAVIFSGSPADILGPQEKGANVSVKTHGRKVGFTNEQIRDNCLWWYRLAEVQNLPVLGICYGHQLISWANGNEVVPMVETIKGWTEVSLMNDQKRLMYRLFGTDWNFDGIVPVHHKRQVRLCPSFTRPFLRSARGGVIHGAIHCKFGGDISDSLSQGRHLALTYQGHPEYAPLQPIKDYRQSGDLSVFKVSMSDIHRVAPDMLLLWARLLGRHARF